jgi:SAM-dependent methyltransferase
MGPACARRHENLATTGTRAGGPLARRSFGADTRGVSLIKTLIRLGSGRYRVSPRLVNQEGQSAVKGSDVVPESPEQREIQDDPAMPRRLSPLIDEAEEAPPGIDVTQPHIARIYDHLLGGKTNFAADREAAAAAVAAFPALPVTARENRRFMARAVRYVAQRGVRQFLDIGTGIPTAPNTYEIAQRVAPDSRVVYVDNDPIVLVHARALMHGDPRGQTAYIQADMHEPDTIVNHPRLREVLDLSHPVALLLVAVLHSFEDSERPRHIVEELIDALPVGSYLIASHITAEFNPNVEGVVRSYRARGVPFQARDQDEFAALAFEGLRVIEPGIVQLTDWHVDEDEWLRPKPTPEDMAGWCGVAIKE